MLELVLVPFLLVYLYVCSKPLRYSILSRNSGAPSLLHPRSGTALSGMAMSFRQRSIGYESSSLPVLAD